MENKKLSWKSPAVSTGNHREKYVSTKFHSCKTKTKKQQQHEKRKGKKKEENVQVNDAQKKQHH